MVADKNEEHGPQKNSQETVAILIFMKQVKGGHESEGGEKEKEKGQRAKDE